MNTVRDMSDEFMKGSKALENIYPDKHEIGCLIEFRLEANVNTYAAKMHETAPTRIDSHDYSYSKGAYAYHDTYVGGEKFAGEEAIWHNGKARYAMNYCGRVLSEQFSGDFLKEALRHANKNMPYRGPAHYETDGYVYNCTVIGDIYWFQGQEEIHFNGKRVYECCFHGGLLQ